MNTYIWLKAKYARTGVKELIRIVYNPYNKPANEIMKDWVLPEYWYQCIDISKH